MYSKLGNDPLSIPVFIGISERFREIEGLTERSVLENTNSRVQITHLYPDVESGCTGFSNVRYSIKYGIYLDCDMIVLGDIAELWSYRRKGRFVCMADGSTEVAVIDCDHNCQNKHQQHLLPKSPIIPLDWNVEDEVRPGMKLLHFTGLNTQPWFYEHPSQAAVNVYERYRNQLQ